MTGRGAPVSAPRSGHGVLKQPGSVRRVRAGRIATWWDLALHDAVEGRPKAHTSTGDRPRSSLAQSEEFWRGNPQETAPKKGSSPLASDLEPGCSGRVEFRLIPAHRTHPCTTVRSMAGSPVALLSVEGACSSLDPGCHQDLGRTRVCLWRCPLFRVSLRVLPSAPMGRASPMVDARVSSGK